MKSTHEYTLRAATHHDQWPIRWLVFSAVLDPTQIQWSQFWVVEKNERVVGCGQLRQFEDAQELGSLVIARSYRRQGLGNALAQHLIQQASHPLYLECLGKKLAQFYTQLGFEITSLDNVPPSLKRKFTLTHNLARVLPMPLTIMHLPQQKISGSILH